MSAADPVFETEEPFDIYYGMQREKLPVTNYVDGYYWRCIECGWLGIGHYRAETALAEAGRHYDEHHPEIKRRGIKRVDA